MVENGGGYPNNLYDEEGKNAFSRCSFVVYR